MQSTLLFVLFTLIPSISIEAPQTNIQELNLGNINANEVLSIFRTKADWTDNAIWTYGDSGRTYFTKDTIVLENNNKYFRPINSCYFTEWVIDTISSSFIIRAEAFLCKEPPPGPIVTLNYLRIEKTGSAFYLLVLANDSTVLDTFKILKVEYINEVIDDNHKPYRISLLRTKQ